MDHQRPAFASPHAVEKLVQGVAFRPATYQAGAVLRQRRWLHRTETRRGANHILSNDDRVLSRTGQGGIVRTRLGSVWHTTAGAPCSTNATPGPTLQSSGSGSLAQRVIPPRFRNLLRLLAHDHGVVFSLAPCTTRFVACALKASATFGRHRRCSER